MRRMSGGRLAIAICAAAALPAGAAFVWDFYRSLHAVPLTNTQQVDWDIAEGSSFNRVIAGMERAGLIANRKPVPVRFYAALYARLGGLEGSIKAGRYRIEPRMTLAGFLDMAASGKGILERLRIIEGATLRQVLQTMRRHRAIETVAADAEEIRKHLGVDHPSLEGWFFPDTYFFSAGAADVDLFRQGYEKMTRTLESVWRERAPGLHLASPYEALILASIVEKETARNDERRRIAGVFLSRLEKGMLLQADPTVIYGMGLQFGGDIRKKDLKADTPYNTYRRKGLPPTPIAMPGLASLQAVLHPEKTGALYFVSRGDGSHHFSKTYGEHRKAVARYQLK